MLALEFDASINCAINGAYQLFVICYCAPQCTAQSKILGKLQNKEDILNLNLAFKSEIRVDS